ncbi:MAG: hypothetical protein AAGC95_05250 [Pseudomonadota bacterium]
MAYLRWGAALFLAAFLVFMGVQKFGAENFIFERIAERSGIELFEPTVRIFVGVMEVAAGVLLILPATRVFGAGIGGGAIGGAVLFHLSPWLGVLTPTGPGVTEESPALFITALAFGGLSLIVLVLERERVVDVLSRFGLVKRNAHI